jgi:hypothetical protein
MAAELVVASGALAPRPAQEYPAVPWRDPQTVSRLDLAQYISDLERRCQETPNSPVLWTCLGMAHAVNYDVVKSDSALETATEVDPTNFWAWLKYGELHYRLRTLDRAEAETLKAVDLAENPFQLSMARKQLKEIRAMNPQRVRRDVPAWALGRALFLTGLAICAVMVMLWT